MFVSVWYFFGVAAYTGVVVFLSDVLWSWVYFINIFIFDCHQRMVSKDLAYFLEPFEH